MVEFCKFCSSIIKENGKCSNMRCILGFHKPITKAQKEKLLDLYKILNIPVNHVKLNNLSHDLAKRELAKLRRIKKQKNIKG